jgi:leucine-rich PPR motif-containing protein
MGKLVQANDVFSTMTSKSLSPKLFTCNILLHGYSKKQVLLACSRLYSAMTRTGFLPDKLTCHSLVLGLCESGVMSRILFAILGLKFNGMDN